MSILTATGLSKSFGSVSVFQNISLRISRDDRIALVGVNGAGKTTLLRILAGLDEPDSGTIHRARGLTIGYLPQEAEFDSTRTVWEEAVAVFAHLRALRARMAELEQAMSRGADDELLDQYSELALTLERAGGYTYEDTTRHVLYGLGFGAEDLHRPIAHLSGGQKTRLALACLLLSRPSLLLLDEPTNHLDMASMEWLEDYLRTYPGAVVVVAHDRRFLDAVARRVLDLSFGALEEYPGNYTTYTTLRAERLEQRRAAYEAQQAVIAKTEEFIRRYGANQRAKEARGRAKRLARLQRLDPPRDHRRPHIRLEAGGRGGDVVLTVDHAVIGYAGPSPVQLFATGRLVIQRGERVALIGPNGSGKTTFLRTILGELSPLSGEVRLGGGICPGYYAQDQEALRTQATVLDVILPYEPIVERARAFLGRFLFCGDDIVKPVGVLSGGERSRLALAKLTMERANFLLLDEPTNHLDLLSQEVLEDVLSSFPGTILFVSHDRYFIDALATHLWVIVDGTLQAYEGNYSDYIDARQARQDGEKHHPGLPPRHSAEEVRRRAVIRAQRTRQARVAELEDRITQLEQSLARLAAEIATSSEQGDTQRVAQASMEYAQIQDMLETALQEWEQVAGDV